MLLPFEGLLASIEYIDEDSAYCEIGKESKTKEENEKKAGKKCTGSQEPRESTVDE